MKFVADENLERSIVEGLRSNGHDVEAIPSELTGSTDREILSYAQNERRILITNDKDFAELTFLQNRSASGVVLVRMPRSRSSQKSARVVEVVEQQGERLYEAMTVIDEEAIRRRALPPKRLTTAGGNSVPHGELP